MYKMELLRDQIISLNRYRISISLPEKEEGLLLAVAYEIKGKKEKGKK